MSYKTNAAQHYNKVMQWITIITRVLLIEVIIIVISNTTSLFTTIMPEDTIYGEWQKILLENYSTPQVKMYLKPYLGTIGVSVVTIIIGWTSHWATTNENWRVYKDNGLSMLSKGAFGVGISTLCLILPNQTLGLILAFPISVMIWTYFIGNKTQEE